MQKIRVCHFYSGNRFGGLEKFLLNIKEFEKFNENVEHVFCLTFEGQLSRYLLEKQANVKIIQVEKISNIFQVLSFFFKFIFYLRKEKIDLVVSHEVWNYILAYLPTRVLRLRHIIWSHTSFFSISLYKFLDYVKPSFVICDSLHVQKLMVDRWGFTNIKTLYYPHPIFSIPQKKVRNEKIMILYLGRLAEYKGLEILVKAAVQLKDLNFEIHVVGEVQSQAEKIFFEKVQKIVSENGLTEMVKFLGARTNVQECYENADIFCHPNTGPEAFGLVFIEALSVGLPVIATDIGGAKEIFSRAKQAIGELVPPKDSNALAMALRKYIENPKLIAEGAEHAHFVASSFCEPRGAMEQMEKVFTSLVEKSN